MAEFLTPLDVVCLDDGLYRLQTPLIYDSDLVGRIIVPEGYTTDFSSVPRLPLTFWLWGNRCHHEGAVHDRLYSVGARPDVSRYLADRVFLEAMEARKKPTWVRWPMYLAVRIGGGPHYKRARG